MLDQYDVEPPVVDGFTHSLSVKMLPTTYRAQVLAQMETLRLSTNYQFKMFTSPDEANATIPAYSQNEYLVKMRPGTLVWGWWISGTQLLLIDGLLTSSGISASFNEIYVQVTDMSTGMSLLSDYEITMAISGENTGDRPYQRYPSLFPGPRLVSGSGQVTIEIYNSSGDTANVQLVLFCAEPMPKPDPCMDPSGPCSVE